MLTSIQSVNVYKSNTMAAKPLRFASSKPPTTQAANESATETPSKGYLIDMSVINVKGVQFKNDLEVAIEAQRKRTPIPPGLTLRFTNTRKIGLADISPLKALGIIKYAAVGSLLKGETKTSQDLAYIYDEETCGGALVERNMGLLGVGEESIGAFVNKVFASAYHWKTLPRQERLTKISKMTEGVIAHLPGLPEFPKIGGGWGTKKEEGSAADAETIPGIDKKSD